MITFFKNFYIKNSSISFFKQNNENERVLVEKFLYSINIGFLVNHARAETNECLKPTIYS
uniref:Uncharacterized protein n=1 Tax=Amorphochlora amoebiformis TaxID=1561963 RepID=A0A0H5BI96_9EUKA|nr:hypothetical protein [Amorphochlora amoebiformis]